MLKIFSVVSINNVKLSPVRLLKDFKIKFWSSYIKPGSNENESARELVACVQPYILP